jgi:metallo-beta-lactamase family protein
MQSTIYFYGGAGSVTGSNFSLDTGDKKILIDCGLEQGAHSAEGSNWEPFAYDPKTVHTLVVTHAHIDHVGRIPFLVKSGFTGPIISTEATRGLAEPMLRDAMELMGLEAKRHGKEPLYDEHDIAAALKLWQGISYHQKYELGDVSLELLDSGHILGSAMAKFSRGGKSIVFTGDLGGGNSPLLPVCEIPTGIDYLVMESVYGDRMRPEDGNRLDQLENVIEDTVARGGTLLIPAFSTERTQDLIFDIRGLMMDKQVPSVPVYLDSPLGEEITQTYLHYPTYFAPAIAERIKGGENIFSFPEIHFIKNMEESRRITHHAGPSILIAGSGMSNGGRVIGHEQEILPNEKSTLLIVGYQAAGSLGRRLVDGEKTVSIHGQKVAVHCRVEHIYGYSAHMQGEQLLEFVNKIHESASGELGPLKEIFVVMGEPASAAFLAQRVRDYLGVKATTPEVGEKAVIDF